MSASLTPALTDDNEDDFYAADFESAWEAPAPTSSAPSFPAGPGPTPPHPARAGTRVGTTVSGRLLWPQPNLRILTYYALMCIIDERDPGPCTVRYCYYRNISGEAERMRVRADLINQLQQHLELAGQPPRSLPRVTFVAAPVFDRGYDGQDIDITLHPDDFAHAPHSSKLKIDGIRLTDIVRGPKFGLNELVVQLPNVPTDVDLTAATSEVRTALEPHAAIVSIFGEVRYEFIEHGTVVERENPVFTGLMLAHLRFDGSPRGEVPTARIRRLPGHIAIGNQQIELSYTGKREGDEAVGGGAGVEH